MKGAGRKYAGRAGAAVFLLFSTSSYAQQNFEFNFAPFPGATQGQRTNVSCNMPGSDNFSCGQVFGAPSDTPFLQETITVGNEVFYHLIVGTPEQGFAQEVFIKTGGISYPAAIGSDSAGAWCYNAAPGGCEQAQNNARTPLANNQTVTGNGTGNPNRVLIKQIVNDTASGLSQEFLKDSFTAKPIITQNIDTADITSQFLFDMSALDYNSDALAGTMTNIFVLKTVPDGSANFDYARNRQQNQEPGINGGRYTFTPTPAINDAGGIYTYYDGTIDPVADVNWESFKNPVQNQR